MNKNKKKIFYIFGGAGFLGQHLTKKLLEEFSGAEIRIADLKPGGHKIYNFDQNRSVKYLYGRDILKPESFAGDIDGSIDAVFNLVGLISFWKKDREKLYEINVSGVRNLCKILIDRFKGRLIHVSSVASVGFTDNPDTPADEEMVIDWHRYKKRAYMYTKHLGEEQVMRYVEKGLDAVVASPGLLYGPGDANTLLPLFRNINSGTLRFYTPGGTGIVDVRDAAAGIVAAYRRGRRGKRYILNAYNLTFKEIFAVIAEKLGKEAPSIKIPGFLRLPVKVFIGICEYLSRSRPALTAETFEFSFRYRYYSSDRAKRELKWKPQIKFNRTVSDMVDWYREKGLLK